MSVSERGVAGPPEGQILEVMSTMRAMRRLRPDPLPRELLERLIEAATWAPSAGNAQACDFVVVTDRAKMRELAALWRRCVDAYVGSIGAATPDSMDDEAFARLRRAIDYQRDHFHETPALIVPCYAQPASPDPGALAKLARSLGPASVARLAARAPRLGALAEAASVYPGVQNLLLTARALGLAANITLWHVLLEHEWKAALAIPRQVRTFAVVPVGWPLGRFGPVRRRAAAEVLHWERW